jgi:phosphoglycerol transferase MdoB-like AlkP superfamily enzyme
MKKLIQGSYYKVFFIRILFVFLLFTLTRILFYALNYTYFNVSVGNFLSILFFGLLFDLAAIIACYSLFIFFSTFPFHLKSTKAYQRFLQIIFVLSTTIAMAGNLLDCEYFKFTQSRTTSDIFNILGLGNDFSALLPSYIKDFWYLFLIWLTILIGSWYFFSATKVLPKAITKGRKLMLYYLKESVIFIFITALCILGFRGGLQYRPLSIINAGQYASAQNVALVLNTPFTILKTIGKTGVSKVNYFDESSLPKIYSPLHNYYKSTSGQKKLNVVIIILESFSKEYIGALNKDLDNGNYKGYTPFLDSLINESLVFTSAYANGKRSIEGIPAVLAGIPALMNDAFITSVYSGNNFTSIASLLKEKGYSSSFFHGGTNGTMGFDGFINSAGFDKYYGRNEYNNEKDYDGKWGIYDEEFLQYTAKTLDNSDKPFVAGIFTLSSHHPYSVPERYSSLFPEGPMPILKSIRYTDFSLRKFFKTLSEKSWFDSTLFVITADHASESLYPEYQTRCGMYEIPILFYQHNSALKGEDKTSVQQIDILPSVIDFLNYDKSFIAYGESVFDSTKAHFAINYVNETYQIIMNDYALVFDGAHSISLYEIRNDSLLTKNIIADQPAINKMMEEKIKGIIQAYNNSLIRNEMSMK